jgi:TetR/AcrR family transcriptional regulator, transcriptional repressor for nem operon
MRKGERTKERILDIAEAAVLAKGFDATSIEELIAEAGITKSGFFYHFRDKSTLARALLERFIERDHRIQEEIFARARELNEDPLQAFLVGLKLFAEMAGNMPGGHPGCLVATYTYQERLFDRDVHELNRRAVLAWRARFLRMLEEIAAVYPPRESVDLEALADMVNTIIEGAIVMSKAVRDPKVLHDQIMLFRSYVRLLFA